MYLDLVQRKLTEGEYKDQASFDADSELIYSNAMTYAEG